MFVFSDSADDLYPLCDANIHIFSHNICVAGINVASLHGNSKHALACFVKPYEVECVK